MGLKETPARNRSCHFSQVNCVFIVVLELIFVPLCMVFLTLKYLAHNRGNYRLLLVFLYFFFGKDNLETYLYYITVLTLTPTA